LSGSTMKTTKKNCQYNDCGEKTAHFNSLQ
jgi:hypothetical protein